MGDFEVYLPQDNRVYQRDGRNRATLTFQTQAPVRARVRQGAKVIKPWRQSDGAIENVPTGGPYTLEVEGPAGRRLAAKGLLVGDLWILAGQSNMDGSGKLVDLEPPSSKVHCFYYDETWGIAKDPLCVLVDSMDPVHWRCEEKDLQEAREEDHRFREHGAGLGVRFGKEILKATGVPVGLIMCSHGGTSMEQWDPAKKKLSGRSLFGSMARRVQACGGRVKGMLWYQGESDALNKATGKFKGRLKRFIQACRKEFDSPEMPFIQVQLSRVFSTDAQFPIAHWNGVQQRQLEIASEIKNVATAAAIDCGLSDIIHLDALSQRRMGARLAELALVLAYGKKAPMALCPDTVRCVGKERTVVRVTFKNVRGRLRPAQGARGFFVEQPDGRRIAITSSRADGESVRLTLETGARKGAKLWYGKGLSPATDLRDDLFGAPVFGPVKL